MMLPKPSKGTAAKATRSRRSAIERAERAAKAAAKLRDLFTCRRTFALDRGNEFGVLSRRRKSPGGEDRCRARAVGAFSWRGSA